MTQRVPELRTFIVLLLMALFVATVSAHEYHVSLAQVEYNEQRGFLEVALQVIPRIWKPRSLNTTGLQVKKFTLKPLLSTPTRMSKP